MITHFASELLKGYRKEVGLSQKEIALECGKSQTLISKLEAGKIKDPPLILILNYLSALGIPWSRFFSELESLLIWEETKIEKEEEKPKELKRDVLRYGLGIRFFRKGVVKFPKSTEKKIEAYLKREGVNKKGIIKYLAFASEYFETLDWVLRGKLAREEISSLPEKWEKEGLDKRYLKKIKEITAKAYQRERKRLLVTKPSPLKKRQEMIRHYTKAQEIQIRVEKEVLAYLFKKGILWPMRFLYMNCAREYLGKLKRGEINSEEERKIWLKEKLERKEGFKEEILQSIIKVMEEAFANLK